MLGPKDSLKLQAAGTWRAIWANWEREKKNSEMSCIRRMNWWWKWWWIFIMNWWWRWWLNWTWNDDDMCVFNLSMWWINFSQEPQDEESTPTNPHNMSADSKAKNHTAWRWSKTDSYLKPPFFKPDALTKRVSTTVECFLPPVVSEAVMLKTTCQFWKFVKLTQLDSQGFHSGLLQGKFNFIRP